MVVQRATPGRKESNFGWTVQKPTDADELIYHFDEYE